MSTDKNRKKLPTAKQYREAAKRLHQEDGECEVGGNARVSRDHGPGEEGAYVQAWVWVPRQAVDRDHDPGNAGCDSCGIADRVPGSKFCAACAAEEPAPVRSAIDTLLDSPISTHCGSMTGAEFREHIKRCEVCADDAEKRTDL
jgi:hypothetical protein